MCSCSLQVLVINHIGHLHNYTIMGVQSNFLNNPVGPETVLGTLGLGEYLEGVTIVSVFTLAEWLESRSSDKVRLILFSS